LAALDPHPDLPRPRQRPASRPADSLGRCSTLELRRVSGLNLWARVDRQIERDALVNRLGRIDERLVQVSEERRTIVDALAELRDLLYPPVPWAKGRRPPDVDCSPMPPAAEGSQAIGGRDLRITCLTILRRHGALPLCELHGLLHRYGYLVAAARPVTALSDAMAYEVERGRAHRVERGVYKATDAPPLKARTEPPLGDAPVGSWQGDGASRLDPDIEEDPAAWGDSARSGVRH